jgi:hypothetical protein
MPDSRNKMELVAECERLKEKLLSRLDDETRERYLRIVDQYFKLARTKMDIGARVHHLPECDCKQRD